MACFLPCESQLNHVMANTLKNAMSLWPIYLCRVFILMGHSEFFKRVILISLDAMGPAIVLAGTTFVAKIKLIWTFLPAVELHTIYLKKKKLIFFSGALCILHDREMRNPAMPKLSKSAAICSIRADPRQAKTVSELSWPLEREQLWGSSSAERRESALGAWPAEPWDHHVQQTSWAWTMQLSPVERWRRKHRDTRKCVKRWTKLTR